MTEQTSPPGPEEPGPPDEEMGDSDALPGEPAPTAQEPTRTGVPSVDAVLSEIEDLDELPLDQHLERFERAHDALRSALDAPAEVTAEELRADPAADEPT